MGKLGRFACILTPMLFTLASLCCTVLVMIGGTNKGNSILSGLYFLKIDTRYINTPEHLDLIPGTDLDNGILGTGINATAAELGLQDFYTSSLWNYCSGKVDGDNWKVTECGKPSATYYFDPIGILNVTTAADKLNFPDSVKKVANAVRVASKVMTAMYVLGLISTITTFVVGWFGLLSRWGSCVTTIFANIALFFLLAGSVIATALYVSIREAFNKALKDFAVNASVNKHMLTITWLAVAFSFGSCIFWLFSTCCCSGKKARVMGTEHKGKSTMAAGGAGRGYERISTPYKGGKTTHGSHVPMTEMGKKQSAGFEPYRHA